MSWQFLKALEIQDRAADISGNAEGLLGSVGGQTLSSSLKKWFEGLRRSDDVAADIIEWAGLDEPGFVHELGAAQLNGELKAAGIRLEVRPQMFQRPEVLLEVARQLIYEVNEASTFNDIDGNGENDIWQLNEFENYIENRLEPSFSDPKGLLEDLANLFDTTPTVSHVIPRVNAPCKDAEYEPASYKFEFDDDYYDYSLLPIAPGLNSYWKTIEVPWTITSGDTVLNKGIHVYTIKVYELDITPGPYWAEQESDWLMA